MNAGNARIGMGNARVHLFARGVYCTAAPVRVVEIRTHGQVLTSGRYVGAEAVADDGERFEEKMKRLSATLREQQAEAAKLDAAITANLRELVYGG
jgi:type I restriction enzyme M protein